MICNHLPFSCRKRILATGGGGLLRMQQPDSTVMSEPSFKETFSFSCDTPGVMSSSGSVPVDSKRLLQIRRSSVISLDSDHSDSFINVKPSHSKNSGTIYAEDQSMRNSPSAHSLTNPSFNFSKKTSTDQDDSDLFFSSKNPESVVQNKSNTPAASTAPEDIELDDFYNDYFDIDDFNDSDVPDYFDERQNSSTVTTTANQAGPSTSSWERKPTTPASTPKPPKISSPGKSAWPVLIKCLGRSLNRSQILRAIKLKTQMNCSL